MTHTLPRHDDPTLSVVMVTHGAWGLAEQAIAALIEHTDVPFELIVVDNASTDETRSRLSRLDGARVILNDQNLGFGPASNQGAAAASGEYLLLLNSDAFVRRGWLAPLLESLSEPAVGAVVPCYYGGDGLLQEAGALLAQDGTVHLYGEGDDPLRGCYRFRRAIDYGSAVCMLMRRDTFDAVGGFDARYGQAYYEDVDLCMRLVQRGMSVLYEPRSTVTHVRYGSGGLDAAVALSEHNRGLFVQRWGARLLGRPPSFVDSSDQSVILARDALADPRFLVCSGACEPPVTDIVDWLLDEFGTARVTWATAPRSVQAIDTAPLLASGVELIDEPDPQWLSTRLFHYDVVLRGEGAPGRLLEAVAQTQPQAPQIALEQVAVAANGRSSLLQALAVAGVAPLR